MCCATFLLSSDTSNDLNIGGEIVLCHNFFSIIQSSNVVMGNILNL